MLELVRFKKQESIHLLMCGFISENLPLYTAATGTRERQEHKTTGSKGTSIQMKFNDQLNEQRVTFPDRKLTFFTKIRI